jgi:hypothetical protein
VGTEKSRDSWSNDQKYCLRATVNLSTSTKSGFFSSATTSIIVFEGDSNIASKSPLFIASYQMHTADVEKELNEGERVGLAFILSLR